MSDYPDKVNRWSLSREDVLFIRSMYSQQWTPDEPTEFIFPDSGIVVSRENIDDFVKGKTVDGRIGKKEKP